MKEDGDEPVVTPTATDKDENKTNHPKWNKLKMNVKASKVNLIRSVRSYKVRQQ